MALEFFKWGLLRRLFGLQRPIRTEPAFDSDEQGLFNLFYGNAGSWYSSQTQLENQRRAMYIDYEAMDFYPVLSAALDTFAEDSTQYDLQAGASIWCVSNDKRAAEIVNDMFRRVLEPNLFGIARSIAKYGDCFEQVLYSEDRIEALSYVQPDLVSRVEDIYGRVLGFTPGVLEGPPFRALPGEKIPEPMSKPWDFVHWRILGHDRGSVHGHSLLQPARRIWRQLKIIEDSMVIYRLNRGPDRLIYYVDVGNMSREEQFRTIRAWRQYVRKSFHRDPKQGVLEQEYDPNTIDQDIYWPTREGSNSKVEKLQGSSNVGDIADVEYFRDMLFAAIKIPKAYLGYEGDVNAKATLAQQDVRYARTLKKLTRAIIEGAMRLAQIELALHGVDALDPRITLEIRMAPSSYLDELQRNELLSLRIELAERMLELGSKLNFRMAKWAAYILYNYMDMSVDAIRVFLNPEGPKDVGDEFGGGFEEPGMGGMGDFEEPGFGAPEGGEDFGQTGAPPGEGGPAEPPPGEFGLDVASIHQDPDAKRIMEDIEEKVKKARAKRPARPDEDAAFKDLVGDIGGIDATVFSEMFSFISGHKKVDLHLELDQEEKRAGASPRRPMRFDPKLNEALRKSKAPTEEHSLDIRSKIEAQAAIAAKDRQDIIDRQAAGPTPPLTEGEGKSDGEAAEE